MASQLTIAVASAGDSNSPGYGHNNQLSAAELLPRRTLIYVPNTELFDRLRIGVNNLGTSATQHGFEAQLANAKDSGYFGVRNLYLIKTGLGGTRVHDWMPGSILYVRMTDRLDKSLALIRQKRNVVPGDGLLLINLWTLGINDMFAGLTAANFKDSIDIILDSLHLRYSTMPFVFTKYNQPSYTGYNTTFDAIVAERPSYVSTIYSADAPLEPDNTHWNTEGWIILGRLLTTVIQNNL